MEVSFPYILITTRETDLGCTVDIQELIFELSFYAMTLNLDDLERYNLQNHAFTGINLQDTLSYVVKIQRTL